MRQTTLKSIEDRSEWFSTMVSQRSRRVSKAASKVAWSKRAVVLDKLKECTD
jgi:hypothetical protein